MCIGILFACYGYAQSKYPDIDRLIEQVKYKRVGLSQTQIAHLKNPFIDEKKLQKIILKQKIIRHIKRRRTTFYLASILNDRAKINGRWYSVGAKVGSYRLSYVDPLDGYVILKNRRRSLRLYMHRKRLHLIKFGSGV